MSFSIQSASARPPWLRLGLGRASAVSPVQRVVKRLNIHTICEEGRCPNRGECYARGTATFLLMGPTCTRSCAFCQVDKGHAPMPVDSAEPDRVASAVVALNLRYVVLTAVARDDLPDQGAGQFARTMQAIAQRCPQTQIEVLTPDFWGGEADRDRAEQAQFDRLAVVLAQKPACFNHNLETVERLQGQVRRGARFERSLRLLALAKTISSEIPTKSGLMLGLGETQEEVIEAMQALRAVDCDRLTLGQYLQPSLAHLPVQRYWTPAEFEELGAIAKAMGFRDVRSGPLVRSSYHADISSESERS